MRPNILRILLGATILAAPASACRKAQPAVDAAPPPQVHPLAGIVGQPLIIAPVQAVRVAPELGWTGLPPNAAVAAAVDSALADTLRIRVADPQWVYFTGLQQSFANNPGYATDPRAFAVVPLRAARWKVGDRLPEPVASQLRRTIAFHDARLVLLPVELRFERTPAGLGRSVVRLVLVDPRASVIRWIGEVPGSDSPTFTLDHSALIAAHIANLFVDK